MYCDPSAIHQAIRQIERWIVAAKQDVHPGIALLHANYAVGDIDMLRQMISDAQVLSLTGKNPHTLLLEATRLQDQAQQKILHRCPGVI